MKITRAVKKQELKLNWYLIDAKGVRLGKLATKCASLLMGKHKVIKSSNMLTGDAVVVINAAKVDVHPSKQVKKIYYRHSGYMGGLKTETLEQMLSKKPRRVIELAVKGMLPVNKLGRAMMKNLHVYEQSEHPHLAQKPLSIEIK